MTDYKITMTGDKSEVPKVVPEAQNFGRRKNNLFAYFNNPKQNTNEVTKSFEVVAIKEIPILEHQKSVFEVCQ